MVKGRKPYPFELVNATNDKNRYTKGELKERKTNQPTLDTARLRCPAHLTKGAKTEWRRIVRLYKELSNPIVTDLDVNALEVYCEAVVTYRKAMLKVRETSEVYVNKGDAKPKKNPWLTVANEAATQMKKYGEILLLDPVSRARASLGKKEKKELTGMAAYMAKRERAE